MRKRQREENIYWKNPTNPVIPILMFLRESPRRLVWMFLSSCPMPCGMEIFKLNLFLARALLLLPVCKEGWWDSVWVDDIDNFDPSCRFCRYQRQTNHRRPGKGQLLCWSPPTHWSQCTRNQAEHHLYWNRVLSILNITYLVVQQRIEHCGSVARWRVVVLTYHERLEREKTLFIMS